MGEGLSREKSKNLSSKKLSNEKKIICNKRTKKERLIIAALVMD